MTVVVLGIDALDPEILDTRSYPDLSLTRHSGIETILSSDTGRPSTHELWPTIITGLPPEEHGIQLEKGLRWDSPLINLGSKLSNYFLPRRTQAILGAWLLENTDEGNFRERATYYENNDLDTVFDGRVSKAIGVPNYVVDPDERDREHELRRNLGDLFRADVKDETEHRHTSSDPGEFYELCMEMAMVRVARTRRALRSQDYELVFGYTSALDLVGHVSYYEEDLQWSAYREMDDFVGELREDLGEDDELVLVSDHGLQEGEHTHEAAISSTSEALVDEVDSVLDVKDAVDRELDERDHSPVERKSRKDIGEGDKGQEVKEHLEDLGYM